MTQFTEIGKELRESDVPHLLTWIGTSILLAALVAFAVFFGSALSEKEPYGAIGFWSLLFLAAISLLCLVGGLVWRARSEKVLLSKEWREAITNVTAMRNDRCTVWHQISPMEYSTLAANRISADGIKEVFTICGFEPHLFARRILSDYLGGEPQEITEELIAKLLQLRDADFDNLVGGRFPHFRALRRLKEECQSVVRLVLESDSRWMDRNKSVLPLFARLNGDVECYIIQVEKLRNTNEFVHFLTDCVIFNSDEAILDYYDESCTLLLTTDVTPKLANVLLAAKRHFEQHKRSPIYRPLKDLDKTRTESGPGGEPRT